MYERIIRQAMMTPWLVTPEYRDVIYGILRFRASGGRLTADELKARIATPERPARTQTSGTSIAVVPVWGVIANRNFDASSGMTSIEAIRPAFRRAVADDDIASVILDFNTPGGTVPGVPELADEIFEARERKTIVAFVDDFCASAGYYLASQCSEIVSMPSAETGSVGAYCLHVSEKGWLEKEGIKVTAVQYGDHKLDANPWNDLDEETLARMQKDIDRIGKAFEAAVARGRGMKASEVHENFGQGLCFDAKEAKKIGMIDRIATFDEVVAKLAGRGARSRVSGSRVSAALTATVDEAKAKDCQTCGGTGLQAEGYMGDPQGQEPCPDCQGEAAPVAQAIDVSSDVEAADATLAILERQ
jgi:signal peptide peptidase SppA